MTKKKILIIGVSSVGLATIVYLATLKYLMTDISPDNYKSKLTEIKASLFKANLQNFIPDHFPILLSYESLNSNNFQNNGLRITNEKTDKGNWVVILSYRTRIIYTLAFRQGILNKAWIAKQAVMDPNSPSTTLIKELIDDLILRNGFMLKRTELKSGSDFIIKETDDCFIIGTFYSYDSQEPVSSIHFSTFSKKIFNIW